MTKVKETEPKVDLQWDEEAGVWIATSESVPGLVLEDESRDVLQERVYLAIPELLELNSTATHMKTPVT
ncbi:MAG: DUF1902 domain-containing protein [Propionibacteriaceae bacterium]|nr:DUF1902 domain-containing protein [Propionibacteriaceae bacterium]